MNREQISDKEGICLLAIFIMGSTLIVGTGGHAKNDAWIAGILGMIMSTPIILVYIRILALFPSKDLFLILDVVFGKFIGKLLSVIYIWYSFHLGALVIRNFGEFINTVTMPETPMLVPMLALGLVSVAAVKCGIEVMARMSAYVIPGIMMVIFAVQILGIPKLNLQYIRPVLSNGMIPILQGAFSAFSFPYAETVLFLGVFFTLKNKKSLYKVYYSGLILAGGLIVLLTARNIMIIGPMLDKLYFPSHVAVSRINVGEFLERIEVTVAVVFIMGVFVKTSICLFVMCKGIANVFKLKDYRSIVIQAGLLMVFLSYIIYDTIMDMQFWAFRVYMYYAFPFQVILPLVIWIAAERKIKKGKKSTC